MLAIIGIVTLVVGLAALWWWLEKKRTEDMQAYAEARGYAFEGEDHSLRGELMRFKLFTLGHSAQVKNAMRGVKELGAVHICDYQYTTGSGKHKTTHDQTIAVLHTPGRRAPHFFVRRQSRFFDALGRLFGGQDINFDDDPEFSSAFVLQTSGDEQQLRHFMSPALREALTRLKHTNLVLEVTGDAMLLHRGKRLGSGEDLDALYADAVNIRRQWS